MSPSAASPARTPSGADMDRHLAGGILWSAAGKWSAQLLSWAALFILARLLSPSDFGLVSMATLYLGLITVVTDCGFGSAVVALRDLDGYQIRQLNSASVIAGAAGFLVSVLIAPALADFFHASPLAGVIVVSGSSFLVSGFGAVPSAVLRRDMRFKPLAGFDTVRSVVQSVTTVLLAVLGFGYWALVLGTLAGAAMAAVLPMACAPVGFSWPRISKMRAAFRLSWHVLMSRVCWYGYSNCDFLVAGRVLGQQALGYYTMAWNIANVPVEKITNLISSVTPSFFSAVQNDPAALRRYLRGLTEGIALLTFPIAVGVCVTAKDFVTLALGDQWTGAILPLALLALYSSVRTVSTLAPQILVVIGESEFVMWAGVGTLAVMAPAFYIGSHWGTVGIAATWVVAYPVVAAAYYWRAFRRIGMPVREYWQALEAPVLGAVAMAAAVVVFQRALPGGLSRYARLGSEAGLGAAVYAAIVVGLRRKLLLSYLRTAWAQLRA